MKLVASLSLVSIIFTFAITLSSLSLSSAFTPIPFRQQHTRTNTHNRSVSLKAVKKASAKKKTKKSKAKSSKKDEAVPTVRKAEFVAKVAEKTGMSKIDSEAALSAVLETITEEVSSGKRISMLGFGTFKLTHRAARVGRNPKTGEEIQIKASKSPSFTAGKAFKEKCNS